MGHELRSFAGMMRALVSVDAAGGGALFPTFEKFAKSTVGQYEVLTLMPWQYCPYSQMEIVSEIQVRGSMGCSLVQGAGLHTSRVIRFPNVTGGEPEGMSYEDLSLRMNPTGLDQTRMVRPRTGVTPHMPLSACFEDPIVAQRPNRRAAHAGPSPVHSGALRGAVDCPRSPGAECVASTRLHVCRR